MTSGLSLESLKKAVAGEIVAYRSVMDMDPAGGPGDKIFPPTYAVGDREPSKYALETRRVDGQDRLCVVLDSVASQANRMEQALRRGWERGEIQFPMILVDFSDEEKLEDLDRLTVLDVPHRIADALLRDSHLDGTAFRLTDAGKALTEARVNHAAPLFRYCPTALVFGVWDSTGPLGGLGAKFTRCLVSEIVGIGAATGVKTASRIDPAQVSSKVPLFAASGKDERWTSLEDEAQKKGKKPVSFGEGKEKGKPSAVNHGNVAPTIETQAGGVTVDKITRTTVLSLSGLRQLGFPKTTSGARVERGDRARVESAGHTALAALGLAAMAYGARADHFLRSRCHLVPKSEMTIEALSRTGEIAETFTLTPAQASLLLSEAAADAKKAGLGWEETEINLAPAKKLSHLIRLSRDVYAAESVVE